MTTADRRMQLLNLLQAVLPAIVEQVVQPEPPKPKVEHKVLAYSFNYSVGPDQYPLPFEITPPEGDGWKLTQLDLPSGLGHWTRVVLVETEEKDTISSPPPDLETSPVAAEAPSAAEVPPTPFVPCVSCGQMPHASTCPVK